MKLENPVCVTAKARELCVREKLDKIFEITSECEGIVNCIDGRLYNPVTGNPTCGNCGSGDTVEAKVQMIYNSVMNLCDSLRSINDKL